jgi:CrcB protein
MLYIWIGLGGTLGTICRYWLSSAVANMVGEQFPWGTLLINVTGSFAIGFFYTLTGPQGVLLVRPEVRPFFMIGFCGGYTTFSSFSLQTLTLARDGQWLAAGGNIVASNLGCLAAVWLGHVCAMAMRRGL